jgi:glycosyltransferase involved in cell wall biosynthesis
LLKVGSLSRVKNQRRLLDALALVRREVDVELDLVGEDTLGGELQAHARTLGIADCVRFHGFVPQDSLRPFFERAHVYVQSSLHDAAPIAVLEAAAASLPIVGTNVGYVADWAPHAAFAVPVDDAEALARGITAMLRNPARDAMAAKAHELVTTHDVGWTANALEALYGGLMSPGLKPGPAR